MSEPTLHDIAREVGDSYGLKLSDLRLPTHRRAIARPRQEAMARMYATGRFSNLKIANFFGLKDHSTVIHARQAVAARVAG